MTTPIYSMLSKNASASLYHRLRLNTQFKKKKKKSDCYLGHSGNNCQFLIYLGFAGSNKMYQKGCSPLDGTFLSIRPKPMKIKLLKLVS